jgi:integrase
MFPPLPTTTPRDISRGGSHVPALVPRSWVEPVLPLPLAERVEELRAASKSDNTRRAYLSDWRRWEQWCATHKLVPIPAHPSTVAAYLADQASTVKVSTLTRHLATIAKAHQVAGVANPCRETMVRDTLAGLRRERGSSRDEAPGLLAEHLRTTLEAIDTGRAGARDRALLLLGWCGALRRSELGALTWGDIAPDPDGLLLTLRRSKTDQEGAGRLVGVARESSPGVCPVAALEGWRRELERAGVELVAPGSPVFPRLSRWGAVLPGAMSGQAVAQVIQRRTQAAGLPTRYRGHSLRKGLVQAAKLGGVSDSSVMATTGHRSVVMLRQYQGQAGLVSGAASKGLLT